MNSPNVPNFTHLLQSLFQTKTIGPSYKPSHILFVLYIIGKEKQGVGRYRIKKEVGLGEGSIKTLLNRLKDEDILQVEVARQRGHILTAKGIELFHHISSIIPHPFPLSNPDNKYVIGQEAYFSLLQPERLVSDYNRLTLAIRDEAIKVGGTGCTTLEFNGNRWFFLDSSSYVVDLNIPVENNRLIKKGTIMVIGGGNSTTSAVLATFAACFRLIIDL
ncbi:DUF4443 domain-containing protein [Candidatus Harpocratesius sp.]